jgi:hypothetical protein
MQKQAEAVIRKSELSIIRTNAIKGNKTDLIENIEIIQMAFVEDKLQQKGR